MSEAESERRTPGSSRPPRNPNTKRRDYPGPPPKPKESLRGEAKRKRGQSQTNTSAQGTSTELVAGKMAREYTKESQHEQNMKLLDVFKKVKAQKTHTTIKMALMNCGELKNYHDTMIEEGALAKLQITTQPKFCPVCESHGTTDLKGSPLMDKPGNHFHQSTIQDRFAQMLKASSRTDISKFTYKCDVCKDDHKINDKLLDRAYYRTVIMAQKMSRSELNKIRDLIDLSQHIDLITIEDGDISYMYWALNADFSGFKAKLRVIYIEPGLQEVKTNAKQGNDITDHAIIMDVQMKLSALNRLVTQWNGDNMLYPIQLISLPGPLVPLQEE
ncbi:MAG: hypothetical protein GY696_22475 [Gammaproteobacteria bacterium]|nr:hypothetical protein [Gammaproteobacteria bacterium]